MAGWTCRDKETIEWDGTIKAKAFDPAGLPGPAGTGDGYTWTSTALYTSPVNPLHIASAAGFIATGDVSGAFLYGDGSNIENIAVAGDNLGDHVATKTVSGANLSFSGHVSGATLEGDGSLITGLATGGAGYTWTSGATYTSPVNKTHVVSAAGLISTDSVSGAFIFGDGSNLTNLPAGGGSGGHTWVSDAIYTNPVNRTHMVSAAGFITEGAISAAFFEGQTIDGISGAIHAKFDETSGAGLYIAYQVTSGAQITHAALTDEHLNWKNSVGTIHADNYTDTGDTTYTGGNDITLDGTAMDLNVGVSSAIHNKFDETSGANLYTAYQSTSGAYIAHAADEDIHFTSDAIWSNLNATSSAYLAHAADTSDPHTATLAQTNINVSGQASFAATSAGLMMVGDSVSGAVVNVYFGTNATAPTANTTPLGSLYVQYTA